MNIVRYIWSWINIVDIDIIKFKIFKSFVDATTLIPKRTFFPEPQEFSTPPNPVNFLARPHIHLTHYVKLN